MANNGDQERAEAEMEIDKSDESAETESCSKEKDDEMMNAKGYQKVPTNSPEVAAKKKMGKIKVEGPVTGSKSMKSDQKDEELKSEVEDRKAETKKPKIEDNKKKGKDPGKDKRETRETLIKKERDRFINMPITEKRKHYKCGRNYKTLLDDVLTWPQYSQDRFRPKQKEKSKKGKGHFTNPRVKSSYEVSDNLNNKVSLWRGDITQLEIDSIVNAANKSLMGGGGVDGAIHSAAGKLLRQENATHKGCDTGQVKLSAGYNLPAKYVISTVGPVGLNPIKLRSCYYESLQLAKENNIRHVAFPCISTGIYGYPNDSAAEVALHTIREWLQTDDNAEHIERIIFCLFLPVDVSIYEDLMHVYFPLPGHPNQTKDKETNRSSEAQEEAIPTISAAEEKKEDAKIAEDKRKSLMLQDASLEKKLLETADAAAAAGGSNEAGEEKSPKRDTAGSSQETDTQVKKNSTAGEDLNKEAEVSRL